MRDFCIVVTNYKSGLVGFPTPLASNDIGQGRWAKVAAT